MVYSNPGKITGVADIDIYSVKQRQKSRPASINEELVKNLTFDPKIRIQPH